MKRRWLGLVLLSLLAAACLPGTGSVPDPAGFFTGIWHGWIAPLSLVVSVFNGDISIYASPNTGWPYDLGFYMAIISGFGGLSLFRRDSKPRKHAK